jgi:calcineurin-like phosphoesterase family protein
MFDVNTCITSDQHIRHKRLVEEWLDRPFSTVELHDQSVQDEHNAVVGPDDHVIWAGDCIVGTHPDNYEQIIAQFNGKKHLVKGNHDGVLIKTCPHMFESIQSRLELEIEGVKILITHKPQDRNMWKGFDIHLHGHSHGKSLKIPGRMDIGLDGNVYGRSDLSGYRGKPWTLGECIALLKGEI